MRQGEATKWLNIFADANEVTPLIFRNLLLKIFRKIENALRPSFVAVRRHQAAEAALNGSSARKAPTGEGLNKEKLIFDLYRLADARHFPRRGKQGERLGMDWCCYLKF